MGLVDVKAENELEKKIEIYENRKVEGLKRFYEINKLTEKRFENAIMSNYFVKKTGMTYEKILKNIVYVHFLKESEEAYIGIRGTENFIVLYFKYYPVSQNVIFASKKRLDKKTYNEEVLEKIIGSYITDQKCMKEMLKLKNEVKLA